MPANNRKPPAKMMDEARQCYELQVAGFSTYQIAEKMGFSQKTVRNRIDLHILKRVHPNVDEMRTRQITRLEAYIRSLWEKAMSGDEKAINAAIRTEERIARLFGTDSATAFVVKTEITDDRTEFNKMLDKLMNQEGRTEQEGNRPQRYRTPMVIPGDISTTYDPKQPSAKVEPADEFRKDSTFEPHEVQTEAVTLADDLEEFEPVKPKPRRRRGQPIPNPAAQFLRDSDDD